MSISNASIPRGAVLDEPVHLDNTRVSWASIFAGLVVALGAWLLLTVLGLALGLSSADPNNPAVSLKSAGTITGIWSLIVPIVALMAGGLVAARTAGVVSRATGAIHGVVLWALVTLASIVLIGFVVRGVVRTAAGLGYDIAGAAASGAPGAARSAGGVGGALGVRSDDLLGPVNQRLRAEGKPAITSDQLDATLKEIVSVGIRQGEIDHDLIVTSLARNTRLTPADADDVATRIEQMIEQKRAEIGQEVQTGAAKAADTTGKAMWWVFLGMLLGLGSAVVGSTLGVSRTQRIAAHPLHERHTPVITDEPAHSSA